MRIRSMKRWEPVRAGLWALVLTLPGCRPAADSEPGAPADLLLTGGRVYTMSWPDPARDGTPSTAAPFSGGRWHPDAEAVAVRDGRIVFVGSDSEASAWRGPRTRVVELDGATVLPGLVDSHVHIAALARRLEQVDLVGVRTEKEAVERVARMAARLPAGRWIVGWGWDEGAWADRYPDMELLSERVSDHPVVLRGLHGFAVWGNRLAFERAGISRSTRAPAGGEILRDESGEPTGVLTNRATELLEAAVPAPTEEHRVDRVRRGLEEMADAGFVMVHQAGADRRLVSAFQRLEREGRLPIRVYVMLSARDTTLVDEWAGRGPSPPRTGERGDPRRRLFVEGVKAFYDGALGSRGAFLLADYADLPGHRGTGGPEYGFDPVRLKRMMKAGFQPAVHAIGDAANRATLDFYASVLEADRNLRAVRPRIEHAQVVDPADRPRFARLGVLASMQPPHEAEDKAWAEARLGPRRVREAYAWRSLRRAGAREVFSSDLPASDYDIFYGWHSAVTRRDRQGLPPGGWYPEERLTPEEAVRGYTTWAAYAAFLEGETGVLATGRWADLTVLGVDPLALDPDDYGDILDGFVRLTVVGGRIVFDALAPDS